MSTSYPGAIDSYTHPQPNDPRSGGTSLSTYHSNLQDAIVALQTKVGADSSAVTSSHDYKLSGVTGTDKAVSKTGTETLTNKTLTAPKINIGSDASGDTYYRDGSGNFQRLAAGAAGTILNIDSGTLLPAWIPNPSASDASTSVKGVVEIATQAEADAGTASGGTSAPLVTRTSNIRARNYNDYVVDTGSATAYAIAPTPAITAYATGQVFLFKATNANTSTTPTLNVNSIGTKTIVNPDGSALRVGQIAAGSLCICGYDSTGGNMQLLSVNNSQVPLYKSNSTQTVNTAVSSATFTKIAEWTGLTGDTDDIYQIDFEIVGTQDDTGAGTGFLGVRLNDGSGANSYGFVNMGLNTNSTTASNAVSAVASTYYQCVISTTARGVGTVNGTIRIKASKTIAGTIRTINSQVTSSALNGTAQGGVVGFGNWTDTSNQITSVQLYYQQSSGSSSTVTGYATLAKINR